jgi:molybdate transport system substrate-binding protein
MPEATPAPVTVLSANAVEYAITGLGRRFKGETGTAVQFTFGTIGAGRRRLAAGETADIVVGTAAVIDEMEAAGAVLEDSRVEIGSTETGLCVRAGAPVPDISTPDKLREALRAARSIAYSDPKVGGTSGVYFTGLVERLGILEEVKRKSVLCYSGEDIVTHVAAGDAEIGTTFVSEFMLASGIAPVGPLPAPVGNSVSYAAALLPGGTNHDAARRFLAMMTAPAQWHVWLDGGFKPAG